MLMHRWIRLERQDAAVVVDKVSSKQESIVFSKDLTDVSYKTLPFYTNYKLYKLVNYATMPVFTMYYMSDGENFITMTGLANPIYEANEKDPIHLTETNVVSYLKFFFRYVQGSEGEVFPVTDVSSIPYINRIPDSKREAIANAFMPISVEPTTIENEVFFVIRANILYGDAMIRTAINVSVGGNISFTEQEIAVSGITLPNSLYRELEYDFI